MSDHYIVTLFSCGKPLDVVLAGSQGIAVMTLAEKYNFSDKWTSELLLTNVGRVVTLTHMEHVIVAVCSCDTPALHVKWILRETE